MAAVTAAAVEAATACIKTAGVVTALCAVGMRAGVVSMMVAGLFYSIATSTTHEDGTGVGFAAIIPALSGAFAERQDHGENNDRCDSYEHDSQGCVIHMTSRESRRAPGIGSARSDLTTTETRLRAILNPISLLI